MRAYELHAHDGPAGLRLVERDDPTPAPGEVLVEVEAIGINFPDLLATRGQYQYRPPLPYVPGCEVAGTVRAVGDDVATPAVGDRVAAFVWEGGCADRVVVPARAAFAVPDGLTAAEAAATVVNYHTVHFALARRGALRPGETVLVLGAGGGIGTAGVQVAAALGARVIAGVADEAQATVAAAAGAPETLVLAPGFAEAVRERTGGRGVDVVLDPLGDWIFDEAVRALAPEGRILVVGFAAGDIPKVAVNRLLLRNASAVGVAWGAFLDLDPVAAAETSRGVSAQLTSGAIRPAIGELRRFAEIPDALERLGRGQIAGKAVIDLSAERGDREAGR